MKLPNYEQAEIPEEKIVGYLLNLAHVDGRGKAIFFIGFGFTLDGWETLAKALREHATLDVAKVEDSPFGKRYVVEGALPTPEERSPQVRSVWFITTGQETPRLVTAYPLEEERE